MMEEFESAKSGMISSQGSKDRQVLKAAEPKVFKSLKKWKKDKHAFGSSSSRNLDLNAVKVKSKTSQRSNSKWGERMEIWNEFENRMVFKCQSKQDAETWIMKINEK